MSELPHSDHQGIIGQVTQTEQKSLAGRPCTELAAVSTSAWEEVQKVESFMRGSPMSGAVLQAQIL